MLHALDLMVPASKDLTEWEKSYGGPYGGPTGPPPLPPPGVALWDPLRTLPTGSDFGLQSHPLLELHPMTVVGH